jgi:hypothetical protein
MSTILPQWQSFKPSSSRMVITYFLLLQRADRGGPTLSTEVR